MRAMVITGLALCLVSAGMAAPAPAPSMHPRFRLLDENGQSVLSSKQPVSTMRTCGGCHDTQYVATHSYHASAGMDESKPAGTAASGRAWDTGPGLLGRWSPLTYVLPANAEQWVRELGARHVGGGPSSAEMNCFLCHLPDPSNDARIKELKEGRPRWAATATLESTGVVKRSADGWAWNADAFDADGRIGRSFPRPRSPTSANCGQCHGQVHEGRSPLVAKSGAAQWSTETKGQIFSAQRLKNSGMNLAGKQGLSRPWDVHAERLLECTSCHNSLNNPAYSAGADGGRPQHLTFEARRLSVGEFLMTPSHDFAKGHTPQGTVARRLDGTMRRCESCHDAQGTHDWLPYAQRHLQAMNCEACHVPQVYAPARQMTDWTVIRADGAAAVSYRGVEGPVDQVSSLVTGFKPVLIPRRELDGSLKITPHNLISSWYWVAGDPPRPVSEDDLKRAFLDGGSYHPAVVSALDGNGDGRIEDRELRLDTPQKTSAIRSRLEAIGLVNPRIVGEIQPYSLHHNVAPASWATRKCSECHGDESRITEAMPLAGYVPGGVMPKLVGDANVALDGRVAVGGSGELVYRPVPAASGRYVIGHDRWHVVDWVGLLAVVGAVLGAAAHGGMRIAAARKQAKS